MYVQYDPGVIVAEAGRLYSEAAKIVGIMIVRGVLAGILLGLVLGGLLGAAIRDLPAALLGGAVVCAAIGGIIGAQMGHARAFFLRLEAQRLLVLAQIEMNTRPR